MKASLSLAALAAVSPVWSTPVQKRTDGVDYTKVQYPPGTGENLPSYPAGTGENLPSYPPGTGENLPSYPEGTGENLPSYPNTGGSQSVFVFTSTYHIEATPDQVVNGTDNPTFTGGLEGASGFYDFGINADLDFICYSIKLVGFRGEYQSPAKTATHVHAAAKGKNGPPRIAFPNPTGDGHERYSRGCLSGMDSFTPFRLLYRRADMNTQGLSRLA